MNNIADTTITKTKIGIIINPYAGNKKARRAWPKIESQLNKYNIPFEKSFTDSSMHASHLAKQIISKDISTIVLVGGDGTLNSLINGLSIEELNRINIGIIPQGTGNDFCRSLSISSKIEDLLNLMQKDQTRLVDLGKVNNNLFANISGFGFDAQVADDINNNNKILTGKTAYLYSVFKLLIKYKNIPLHIIIDNQTHISENIFLAAVGNTGYYGGGINIIPSAKPDDGYFHICTVGDIKKRQVLKALPGVFSGKHLTHPLVNEYKAKEVNIHFADKNNISPESQKVPVHADGEILTYLPAKFNIITSNLKIFAP